MTKPIIITNGIVLTCDQVNRCGQYNILVSGGKIVEVADGRDALMREHPEAMIVDATNKLVVPGFVNAHFHGESFLLRAATQEMHFGLWKNDELVRQSYEKLLQQSSHDDILCLYLATYLAHLRSGTTCVGEFAPPFDEQKFRSMVAAIAASGVMPVFSLQNWDQIRTFQSLNPKPKAAVSLGGEDEYTVYRFEQLSKAAKEMGIPLLAHVAETSNDVETVRKNFQRGCLTLLNLFNVLRENTIVVHANFASEEEVELIRKIGGTVVVSARSTAMKQTGYPSLRFLAQQNVRCCLGTDWGNTDMLAEMRFMHQLQLVVAGLRPFSAYEIVRMATINGAIALGVDGELGSIEAGKRADVTFFDLANTSLPVVSNSSSEENWSRLLVEHLSASDISEVMIGGMFKMRNGEFVEHNESDLLEDFRLLHKKFFPASFSNRTSSVPPSVSDNAYVLPFFNDSRMPTEQPSGFEAGFAPSDKSSTILDMNDRPTSTNPLLNRPKVNRPPIKPELPKNTRRVFGEDEDI
jgi:5-methylthioadenosine/S-adenosylhomocysteine deaminase